MTPRSGVLMLGVGNVLLGDEGVGVRVAQALMGAEGDRRGSAEPADGGGQSIHPGMGPWLPPGTRVVDGGTLGLALLPLLSDARGVVLIDAVDLSLPPGSVAVIRGQATRSVPQPANSAHELGLATLLETARFGGQLPSQVTIVGVQPGRIAAGLELSPAVGAAVPGAVARARREAWAMAAAAKRLAPASSLGGDAES